MLACTQARTTQGHDKEAPSKGKGPELRDFVLAIISQCELWQFYFERAGAIRRRLRVKALYLKVSYSTVLAQMNATYHPSH